MYVLKFDNISEENNEYLSYENNFFGITNNIKKAAKHNTTGKYSDWLDEKNLDPEKFEKFQFIKINKRLN